MHRGLAHNVEHARQLVADGRVRVGRLPVDNPARMMRAADPLHVEAPPQRFVSRGGDKLRGALTSFAVPVASRRCLDVGASTGGFSDCLLQAGASSVVAVDVGRAQLHTRLLDDPRLRSLEGRDVVGLTEAEIGAPFDVIVADVSFRSLSGLLPAMTQWLAPDGDLVALMKPQFESSRSEIAGTGGVIRSPEVWESAAARVAAAADAAGARINGWTLARPAGRKGNREFFVWIRSSVPSSTSTAAARASLYRCLAEAASDVGDGDDG